VRQLAVQRLARSGDVTDHAERQRPEKQGKRRGDAKPHAQPPDAKPAGQRDEHGGAGEKQTEGIKRPHPPGNWRLVSHRLAKVYRLKREVMRRTGGGGRKPTAGSKDAACVERI
jgi:hypothetical protein